MPKFLIVRLSSIGDIIQCMGVISGIRHHYPDAEIHWVTRADMAQTISMDSRIDKVWSLDKDGGFSALIALSRELKAQRFDYVYDAHNNIRSGIIQRVILRYVLLHRPHFVRRSKSRFKRFMLFKWGVNRFEWPFIGVESFRKPLAKWGITKFDDNYQDWRFPQQIIDRFDGFIAPNSVTIIPSANWEMKRWPVSHWKSLIELLPEYKFIVLGGPNDTFCDDICSVAPERTINMAGKSSIMESSYLVMKSRIVVSGDTGFLHSADLFLTPAIALIGPTAFGFPARPSSEIISLDMKCRPCTKDGHGECVDSIYQRCMVDITPQRVALRVRNILPLAQGE